MVPDPSPATCDGLLLPFGSGAPPAPRHRGWGPWVPFCSVRRIRPAAPPRFIQLNPAAGRSHPRPAGRVPAQPRGPGGRSLPAGRGLSYESCQWGVSGGLEQTEPRGAGHSLRAGCAAHPEIPVSRGTRRFPSSSLGDSRALLSAIPELSPRARTAFLRVIPRDSRGASPEATLVPLSLFQPSFFTLTVGRRTDKGMRVTRAAVLTRWPPWPPGCPGSGIRACAAPDVGSGKPTAKQMQGIQKCLFH